MLGRFYSRIQRVQAPAFPGPPQRLAPDKQLTTGDGMFSESVYPSAEPARLVVNYSYMHSA